MDRHLFSRQKKAKYRTLAVLFSLPVANPLFSAEPPLRSRCFTDIYRCYDVNKKSIYARIGRPGGRDTVSNAPPSALFKAAQSTGTAPVRSSLASIFIIMDAASRHTSSGERRHDVSRRRLAGRLARAISYYCGIFSSGRPAGDHAGIPPDAVGMPQTNAGRHESGACKNTSTPPYEGVKGATACHWRHIGRSNARGSLSIRPDGITKNERRSKPVFRVYFHCGPP